MVYNRKREEMNLQRKVDMSKESNLHVSKQESGLEHGSEKQQ